MPTLHDFKPSFNAGEVTPHVWARTDFSKYPNAVETMENLIPLAEGGAMRRAGTRYVAELKSSAVKGRLKRFEFSTTQSYILEMGEQMLRFCRNQAQITVPNTDAVITNGAFTSNITGWDDLSTGSVASISHDAVNLRLSLNGAAGELAIAEQDVTVTTTSVEHVLRFRVLGAPGDSVKVRIGSASGGTQFLSDFTAYVGWHSLAFTPTASPFYIQFENGAAKNVQIDDVSLIDNAPVEVTTPWTEAQLFTTEGPQSADVLYNFHISHPTYKLERRGHTTWSMVEVAWQDGPWLDENDTSTTLTFGAATGLGVTVTASSTTGINGGDGFKSTDVGRLIRLTDNTTVNWGWAVITAFTNTTTVTVDIKRTVAVTTAETRWRLGSWSGTTGYPSTGSFYEQRLLAAGNTDQPQTFWASQTADFENHSPDSDPNAEPDVTFDGTVEDDDAFDFTMSADNVNAIRWLSAGEDTLSLGTIGGEWIPTSVGAVLTPTDIVVRRQTTHGTAQIQPVRVDNVVLFVQRAKRKIREFGFNFESDSYKAPDMTRLARHITFGGIVEMDFAEEPNSLVLAVRDDGQLLSMTFRREEDVVGWARQIIGGVFGAGDAVVDSVAVIPGNDGAGQTQDSTDRDEVWMIVKRTINGATVRYIEFLERDYENGHDQEDAYYLDSMVTYDGSDTTSITGLNHLEGATVGIWADGAIQPDKTVSGGAITLDIAAGVVQAGLRYQHTLKTLKFEGGNPFGTAVGKKKKIHGMTLAVLNSHTVTFGPDTSNLVSDDFRVVSDPMDAGAPLFTGEKFFELDGSNWDTDSRIVIQNDDPCPFTLLAIAPEITVNPIR